MAAYFEYYHPTENFINTLQELPSQDGYAVLFVDLSRQTNARQYYVLIYSSEPWVLGRAESEADFNADILSKVANITAAYECYVRTDVTDSVGSNWSQISFDFGDAEWASEEPTYLFWTNHDICRAIMDQDLYESEGIEEYISTGEVAYPTSKTIPIARKPVIVGCGTTNDADSNEYGTSAVVPRIVGQIAAYWYLTLRLVCRAYTQDDGELTIDWYSGNELVQSETFPSESLLLWSVKSEYRPPIDETGTKSYHAVVTNTINGVTASVTSNSISVTTKEYNFENYPDGTEDFTHDVIFGIDEPEEEIATPDELKEAYWKGFSIGKALYGG